MRRAPRCRRPAQAALIYGRDERLDVAHCHGDVAIERRRHAVVLVAQPSLQVLHGIFARNAATGEVDGEVEEGLVPLPATNQPALPEFVRLGAPVLAGLHAASWLVAAARRMRSTDETRRTALDTNSERRAG